MNSKQLLSLIENGDLDDRLISLYGKDKLALQKLRYTESIHAFEDLYGEKDVTLFSVPGRSEISGNHTDHNRGRVIAAAVDLDIIAVASKKDEPSITVKSKGFPADTVSCMPGEPDESLFYSSASLIAGTCAEFTRRGFAVGGYDCYTTSSVLKGSGISSSAAFEVMIGTILNHFYNGGTISNPVIAEVAQFAENVYFGKPSGLMDQTACAVGGFAAIDFGDPKAAQIEKLDFDLSGAGYALCITNTGGNHADLNEDYASVPAEMKAVAAVFGQEVLRGVTKEQLIAECETIRRQCGDRAFLRAFHFIGENDRVVAQTDALRRCDLDAFFAGVRESGRSSFMWLQNVYTTKNVSEQGLSLALAVTEEALSDCGEPCAWRIHGGGFAGTIQAFVPNDKVASYKNTMDGVFGVGACAVLHVRAEGAAKVF